MRSILLLTLASLAMSPASLADPCPEIANGSFRLETGETITGGLFVERAGSDPAVVYLDTANLDKGGIFTCGGDGTLRSVSPPDGAIEIRFESGRGKGADSIFWESSEGVLRGKRVFPHDVEAVRIESADGTRLRGRLLTPRTSGTHPLVVLVGGSGPSTQYAGPFETFFIQLGMAVLVFDKRGIGNDPWREPDLIEMAEDAAAGIRFGRSHAGIDPRRVGLWGSSQGGWVAPIAATMVPVDFMIVRVGPGVTEKQAYGHETRQEWREDGLHGLELDDATSLLDEVLAIAVAGGPMSAADELVRPWVGQTWYRTAFGDGLVSEIFSTSWWGWVHRNMTLDTMEHLASYEGPVLWFLAENDQNVPLVASVAGLRRAFDASKGHDQELVVVPDVDHSFLTRDEAGLHYTPHFWEKMRLWLTERGFTGARECE